MVCRKALNKFVYQLSNYRFFAHEKSTIFTERLKQRTCNCQSRYCSVEIEVLKSGSVFNQPLDEPVVHRSRRHRPDECKTITSLERTANWRSCCSLLPGRMRRLRIFR